MNRILKSDCLIMFETYPGKKEEIYNEHLQKMAGIKLTFREVDIVACILHNRGEKKTGSILSISYRTVGTHVRNVMGKMSCNSRDDIIDKIEKSGKLQHFREYYYHLIIESLFNSKLCKVASLLNHDEVFCLLNTSNIIDQEKKILEQATQSLNLARINLLQKNDISKKIQCVICMLSETVKINQDQKYNENIRKLITLLFDKDADISLYKNFDYIDFRNNTDYYFSVFKLIEKITDKPEVIKIFAEFKNEYRHLQSSYQGVNTVANYLAGKPWNIFYKNKLFIGFVSIVFFVFLVVNNKNNPSDSDITTEITNEIAKTESWNLPNNIGHYTERKNITNSIWNQFNDSQEQRKTVILVGLHGLGGIGKTTLAKDVIHNPQQHYSFKGWFSAETTALLQADYFEVGEKHSLFSKDMSDKQKIIRVKDWLEQQEKTLLVYDNVPNMEMLEEYLPNKGHIIITSRNYKLSGVIAIEVMTEAEATELLDNLIPEVIKQKQNYKNDLAILAKELGYLPLALSQAGAYIAENMLTIPEYLSLYTIEKDRLLSSKIMPAMDKHEPAYVTWDMSLKKISQRPDDKKALELLDFVAYCYPEHIPQKLLAQYLYRKADGEATITTNQMLSLLKQYSLVKTTSDTVSVHRLVHSWLQSKHSREKKLNIIKKAVIEIKSIYPWKNKTTQDIAFMKTLLPHAEALLLQAKLLLKEVEYVDLLIALGNSYHTLGDYYKSKQFYERALTINKKHFGENSIEIAKILHDLGKSNIYLGNYIKAKELLEQALLIRKKHFGENSVEIADTLHHLGKAHLSLGNYSQSKQLLEKALAIKKKYYGADSVETIHTLHQLGITHLNLGNYIKAKELLEQTLLVNMKHYGTEHTETARTLHNLARVQLNLGDYIKAKELLEETLLIREKHFGYKHIETTDTLQQLGRAYLNLGNYFKAKELLEKTLIIHEKYYGTEHIEITSSLCNLARVHLNSGNHSKAKELLEKALLIHEKYDNSQPLMISNILGILGTYYLASGDYYKGKELFEAALKHTNGNDNIFTTKSLANLGNVHRILGNNQKSKKLLEQALLCLENHYGYDKVTIAKVMGNLSILYGNLGDDTKKKEYLKKALAIFKERLHPDHPDIKLTISELNKANNFFKKSKDENLKIVGYPIILLP